MRCLLIDTSSSNIVVSLIENNDILFSHEECINNDLSSKIISLLDEELKKVNIELKEIDKLFVINGPGSFTGVRIGVTIGKVIAWALNKEIVTISSLELMATTKTDKKYIVPMIDARRGNVFAGIYDNELNNIVCDNLISIKDLVSKLDFNYELVSYDNLDIENLKKPSIDIMKVIKKHIDDITLNSHKVNPRYLKMTEAEENKLKND